MGRVTGADVRRILDFLSTARVGTPADPIPAETLVSLRSLIGADEADYFELRRADRAPLAFSESDHCEAMPGTEEAAIAFGAQNPLGWRLWSPADGSMRLSTRAPHRAFRRTEWYGEFLAPNRITDVLKVWLSTTPDSVACVQLWRHGGTFSRRDQDVLAILQHDLIRLRAEALAGRGRWTADSAALTTREAEVLVWAIRGHSHADIAHRLGFSAATVGKHLEHAYQKLDVRSRSEAVDRILLSGPNV
jgi:DNA-binding CsgD family transcriptional regulator